MSGNYYIIISVIGILLIFLILVITYASYSGQQWSFSPYDPSDNPYVVGAGENGLQYVNINNTDVYIDTDSTAASNKTMMINRALSELQVSNGYIATTSDSSTHNIKVYIVLIFFTILCLAAILTWANSDVADTKNGKTKIDNSGYIPVVNTDVPYVNF